MHRFDTLPAFHLKAYDILVSGFSSKPCRIYAKGPGVARGDAFRQFQSSYPETSFKSFMKMSTIRRAHEHIPEDFGTPVIVSGEPGYRIDELGGHLRFIRPGQNQILLSHPLDVAKPIFDKTIQEEAA
jgi:hypothetical protein